MAEEVEDILQNCNYVDGEDPTLNKFLNWCKGNGLILSEKVKVCSSGSCHRYGMIASEDIPQDECLFSIPRRLLLEPKTCSISDILREFKAEHIGKSKRGSGWIPLLLTLMYEHTNPSSFWRPYLDIVPSIDVLDQPMFWNQDDRIRLLKDTEIEEDIEQDLKCIEKEYFSFVKDFIKKNENKFDQTTHSLALYKHMAAFIMAYSFTEDSPVCLGDNEPLMVPMADILNHRSDHNAHLEFGKDELRMVSTQPILKGQEVFNTYGRLANCHLLQSYGFVEKTPNPSDTMDISVGIFYDVLQQLTKSKHEARILDAKFQVMEEMGVASSDDVFVFDLTGCQNQGPDLTLFLKVLQLSEQKFKEILLKDQENSNYPVTSKDLQELVCLFENCSDEQKCTSSKILERAFNVQDRKRRNDSLVEKDLNNVDIKKAKSRLKQFRDSNFEDQRNDDNGKCGYNKGSIDIEDFNDANDDEDDDDDDNEGDDANDDDDEQGEDDDYDDEEDKGEYDDDDTDEKEDDAYDDEQEEEEEEEDNDDDNDSEDSDSKPGNEDDGEFDYLTYEEMKEFPLNWRETLSRVGEYCLSRIIKMEKEKQIDKENILELTTREQTIKEMLSGLKNILRRICDLVTKRGNEHPS